MGYEKPEVTLDRINLNEIKKVLYIDTVKTEKNIIKERMKK